MKSIFVSVSLTGEDVKVTHSKTDNLEFVTIQTGGDNALHVSMDRKKALELICLLESAVHKLVELD